MKKHIPTIFFFLGIGLLIILLLTAFFIKCPNSTQCYTIYVITCLSLAALIPKSTSKSSLKYKSAAIKFSLFGDAAIFFLLFYYNPIGYIHLSDECKTLENVVVFVRGNKSKQDIILTQGKVIMDINNESKEEPINEKGQANFENVYIGDSVRLGIDFSEPYKSVFPDSIYVIPRTRKIYLEIYLAGINIVKGKVLTLDNIPIDSVLVNIDTIKTYSDKSGSFFLPIPDSMQQKEYEVWFTKKGFITIKATAMPETKKDLIVPMEKISSN
jgi:hypothetical protein